MSRRVAGSVLAIGLALSFMNGGSPLAAPSRAQVEAAKDRLMQLEKDFELVSERYNLAHEKLTALQARIGAGELIVRRLERRMKSRQSAAINLATELYKNGTTVTVETILSSDSLAELDARIGYLERSQSAQAQVFDRLAADRSRLEAELKQLEVARAEAVVAEQKLAELRATLDEKVVAQRDEIDRLNAQIERAERRAAARARAAAAAAAVAPVAPSTTVRVARAPAPNQRAQVAVDAALSQIGKPYSYGAAGPDSYDCSGLTMWAWAQAGVSLPHNSGAQYGATTRVDRSDWEPGDLLFFGTPIHHVGMYIGNGQMVEAPYTGGSVQVVSASRSDYVGAGRPGV
ncbi:MAG: NlpC/P60 family protein [Actinomycetota bacterium]